MKKRILSLILSLAVSLSLMACGNGSGSSVNESAAAEEKQTAVSETAAETEATDTASPEGSEATDDTEESEEEKILVGVNIIPNGDFSSESSKWGLYHESGGSATYSQTGKLKVRISSPGKKAHSVQMYCDGFQLYQDGEYEMSFDISSDVERTFEWRIQVNGGDYHPYVSEENVQIGPEETHVSTEFVMSEGSDPAPRLCFNLGDAKQAQGLEKHEVIIDNVSLVLKKADKVQDINLDAGERDININQIGYKCNDTKTAVFRDAAKDTEFEVINADTNKSVFSGKLTEAVSKGTSYEKVAYGDFSDVKTPGRYYIKAANSGESFVFSIGDDIYDDAFDSICRMLYLQRCGMELTEEYAGDFAHKACHTEKATIYGTDKQIEVSGGWHDAGDYGRYTVPAAKTVADMMLAYENYPEVFSDNSGIPESGNNVPDILDEVRYELEWLLKMQGKDGGVYHKVTGLNFDGVVMPEDCTEKLYVLPESKTATGDFSAVMFMASRVYKDIDSKFASKCQKAAIKALPYLEERLDESNYSNPSDVSTGEYPDGVSRDEYLWALCEGYKATGNTEYADKIRTFDYSRITDDGLGWATVTEYAYYSFLTMEDRIKDVPYNFEEAFLTCVNELRDNAGVDSYGSSIIDEYTWGSNMNICNNGIMMLMAGDIFGDDGYTEAAGQQLDYIFGVNTCSYCFVTGEGTLSPVAPHHRPSQFLEKTMPGMLVGGPDSNLEDPFAKTVLKDYSPAHRYIDNAQSYSCNEITIYWNSALIYLMAGLAE